MEEYFKNKKILVVAPHYDDEVIGCGGSLIKYRDIIKKLSVVHMSFDKARNLEYEAISKKIAVNESYQLYGNDGYIGTDYGSLVKELVKIVQIEKPSTVFVTHCKEEHVDHESVNSIVVDAVGKARYWKNDGIDCWKSDNIIEYEVWTFMKKVSFVVDISEQIGSKQELMKIYESQSEFPYIKYIEYFNGYRGLTYNRNGYSECFRVLAV